MAGTKEKFRRKVRPDLLIAGGGLSGGLLGYLLRQRRPELSVLLLEREAALGGEHTWSFHESDLPAASLEWVRPLVSASWPGYSVQFPAFQRRLEGRYHSLRSTDFHRRLSAVLGEGLWLGAEVKEIRQGSVVLATGESIEAGAVIDARGRGAKAGPCGYQKFFGLDLALEGPHGLVEPLLMDACLPQEDGYHFMYLLPWSESTLLVEATFYSDTPGLSEPSLEEQIFAYAGRRGWRVREVARRERGVLPIPFHPARGEPHAIGMRGGLFHQTTGYSLPQAVRVAETVAALPRLDSASLQKALARCRKEGEGAAAFLRGLNRMLFQAAEPEERIRIFEKFYRLPEATIQRFYGGALTPLDLTRILSGRPPLPVAKAMAALLSRAAKEASL